MPVDDEKIKAALDDFEDEKFSDAKDKISGEVKKLRDEFLKDKLKLKGDLADKEEEEEEKSDDDKDEKEEKSDDADDDKDDKKALKKRVAKAIKKKQDKDEE